MRRWLIMFGTGLALVGLQPAQPDVGSKARSMGNFSGGSGAHLAGFGDSMRGSLLELLWL
jgi:hypothetical protein